MRHNEAIELLEKYSLLLQESRDLLLMCSLMDRSGMCKELVERIDKLREELPITH